MASNPDTLSLEIILPISIGINDMMTEYILIAKTIPDCSLREDEDGNDDACIPNNG